VAALAQVRGFGEHGLFARVRFDVLAIRAQAEPELDIADRPPLVGLCCSASRVRSPIALVGHCTIVVRWWIAFGEHTRVNFRGAETMNQWMPSGESS
jgi:hypothetical protein